MNGRTITERILDVYLAPEADRLPDRVIDSALADIARTPQRHAVRVPWRFPTMPALSRATGIAAVALVAVVGVGGLLYFSGSGGPGRPTPAPTATQIPTTVPEPTQVAPGIDRFERYTSPVYGYTISYPSDWSVGAPASRKWAPGEAEDGTWADTFQNDDTIDGDGIAFFAVQIPAPTGADLDSWEGLVAALQDMCARPAEFAYINCPKGDPGTLLCRGAQACQPALIASSDNEEETPMAVLADPETGLLTVLGMGRPDDFPAAARYGGIAMLLKSILGDMGVREPRPGETPG